MSSTTMTATALQPVEAMAIQSLLDRQKEDLNGLLKKFEKNQDFLSLELLEWGNELLATLAKQPADKIKVMQERINWLAKNILVNPFDRVPLEDPVVERQWVWDRQMHKVCRDLCNKTSPLDKEPMAERPFVHDFAKEMIAWLKKYQTLTKLPHEQEVTTVQTAKVAAKQITLWKVFENQVVRVGQCLVFEQLAVAAVRREQDKQEVRMAHLKHEQTLLALAETKKNAVVAFGNLSQRLASYEQKTAERIDALEKACSDKVSGLKQEMSEMNEAHAVKVVALEQQLVALDQSQKKAHEQIQLQITAMKKKHSESVGKLEQEMIAAEQEKQAEIQQFTVQLHSSVANHASSMASLSAAHQSTVNSLESSVADSNAKVVQVQQILTSAVAQNAQQVAELAASRAAREALEHEMALLRQQVNNIDDDDSFCIVS